jgi:hypothetical protein
MPQVKKKMIVREIKSNIKVTEINKEPVNESETEEQEEPSLEDIAETGLSARVFPTFEQRESSQQTAEPEQTRTQETPENRGPIYQVQTNVTEQELRQKYESQGNRFVQGRTNIMGIAPSLDRREAIANRELETARPIGEEDEKYSLSNEPEQKKETRRYPWEA